MVTIGDITFERYIDRKEIDEDIRRIAREICSEYKDKEEKPIFLVTLSGAMFFAADLLRELDFCPEIGFVKCSSYGSGTTSSGRIDMKIEPTLNVKDRDVIVLEDVIETGLTWRFLKDKLTEYGAKRARIAAMVEKDNPDGIHGDWIGRRVGKSFLIGMGMDYAETGQNFPDIYKATQG